MNIEVFFRNFAYFLDVNHILTKAYLSDYGTADLIRKVTITLGDSVWITLFPNFLNILSMPKFYILSIRSLLHA